MMAVMEKLSDEGVCSGRFHCHERIIENMGTSIAPVSTSTAFFDDLAFRFLHSSEFSPTTVRTYRTALNAFFGWLADSGIGVPGKDHVVSWKMHLRERHSLSTVQTYLAAIRLFFKWTSQQGMYTDIASSVKNVRVGHLPKRDFLLPEQVLKVLKTAQSGPFALRDYTMILLMVTCGLRVSEVARADVGDIRDSGGTTVLYIHGKGRDGKTDMVNVPRQVASALSRYLASRSMLTMHSPLFASASHNNHDGRLSVRSVSRIVKGHLERSGFSDRRITAHSLRHTAVTISLTAGATLQQVQQFARHSLIVTTQIYAHNLEQCRNPCSAKIVSQIMQSASSGRIRRQYRCADERIQEVTED